MTTLHFPILLNWRVGELLGNWEVVAQGACWLEKVRISPPSLPPAQPNPSKNSVQQVHSWPLLALKCSYFWGGMSQLAVNSCFGSEEHLSQGAAVTG